MLVTLLVFAFAGVLGGCVGDTDDASKVTSVSATLNAHGHTTGVPAYWWWEYSASLSVLQAGHGLATQRLGPAEYSNGDVSLSTRVTGLTPSTTYYFRACGQDANSTQARCGSVKTFETDPPSIGTFTPFIRTFGSVGSGPEQFGDFGGIATDSAGNLYAEDPKARVIKKFSPAGAFIEDLTVPDDGYPSSIAIDKNDNIYVGSAWVGPYGAGDSEILKFDTSGKLLTRWGSKGTGPGQFSAGIKLATDPAGNVYATDFDTRVDRVEKFDSSGRFLTQWGTEGTAPGQFFWPDGIATDPSGYVYVVDHGNHRIQKFDSSGRYVTSWGTLGSGDGQFHNPSSIAIDSQGNVSVIDWINERIEVFTSTGQFLGKYGSKGDADGQFSYAFEIAVDRFGHTFVADGYPHYRIAEFAPTRTGSAIAATFEPVLRFDNSEKQRPLNVDTFLAEGGHLICDGSSCSPIATSSDLLRHNTASSYIDVAGRVQGGSAAAYHSPNPTCTATGLADCDSGPASSIYYRVSGPYASASTGSTGYTFIDYWFFYRFNDFASRIDQHEGDWEAVTVAPAAGNVNDPATFDFAGFSQHGHFATYLRSNLSCQASSSAIPPSTGTCDPQAKRLAVMVAHGSHANYPKACSENITMVSCRSSFSELNRERGYDGSKQWGNAYNPGALLALPLEQRLGWSDWAGTWGKAADGWCNPTATSSSPCPAPASPLQQSVGLECSDLDNLFGCDYAGPRAASVGRERRPVYRSPGLAAASCSSWLGAGVTAVVCNPAELRRAIIAGDLGEREGRTLGVPGSGRHGAVARGVVQLVGSPVRPRQEVTIRGPVGKGTELLLRVRDKRHHRILNARYRLRPTRRGAGGHRMSLRLWLATREGRTTPLLAGMRPFALRAERPRREHR